MSLNKQEVLVIGGGIAACVAAAAVLKSGRQVTMIFPNGGNSEISPGAVDIMGVVPGEKPLICEDYKEGIPKLLLSYPDHIYGKCQDALDHGIKALVSLAAAGGYPLEQFDGKNVWVPNMLGTFSINAYVPATMSDGIVEPGKKEKILVVGVKGNAAFHAAAAAKSYQQYQKKLGGEAEYFSAEIQLKGWGDRRKVSDGELADYLDTREGAEELTSLLAAFCQNNRYIFDKVLLPPVLGYLHYREVLNKIKEACGCKVGEVSAVGNSVTGYRFTRAIYRGLKAQGATLLRGAVAKAITPQKDQVTVDCIIGLTDQFHPGEKKTLTAAAVILATGGFIGGGIKARKTEVWIELLNQNLGKITADTLDRNAVSPAGQGFMKMGVNVNDDMSVQDEKYNGRVFACGNVLSGHNAASERSGAGIAAATAYLAGKQAAAKTE